MLSEERGDVYIEGKSLLEESGKVREEVGERKRDGQR